MEPISEFIFIIPNGLKFGKLFIYNEHQFSVSIHIKNGNFYDGKIKIYKLNVYEKIQKLFKRKDNFLFINEELFEKIKTFTSCRACSFLENKISYLKPIKSYKLILDGETEHFAWLKLLKCGKFYINMIGYSSDVYEVDNSKIDETKYNLVRHGLFWISHEISHQFEYVIISKNFINFDLISDKKNFCDNLSKIIIWHAINNKINLSRITE